ncbi:CRISPR-associated helicase Cas3 [Caldalkalibacillus thermarum TA2.A1]|uniref:CRISPR-associated helicase Cas3 n=1 Tax=Caldalkalibacillus thermarum (strain TA2.A1) TaxID=986075 RepID=F5L3W2_CALTT|nr:CRISPR-associated helicase/endonuclease Cas3 [Caldalkalibacillus thermarum]EGL83972.1 CRISPR-associated helicase Cas3 [Caldalkalibacillus thermarum TA2.A1]
MFYAKSHPPESLKEHTERLLENYELLQAIYKPKLLWMDGRTWDLLYWAAVYHDVGKADPVFQNKIRTALNKKSLPTQSNHDVPHNYLSALLIPYKDLNLSKEETKLLAQAVGYHHERERDPDKMQIKENYESNIVPILDQIEAHIGVKLAAKPRLKAVDWLDVRQRLRPREGEWFYRYVMVKGLLHRLDHAASAGVAIELAHDYDVGDYVNRFIANYFGGKKRPLQQFAEQHQHDHVIAIAQTGMGKTEAGLLWIGKEKGFFTLPLRVSINAMYRRIQDSKKIGFTSKQSQNDEERAIGLLHSTSMDFLYDNNEKEVEVLYQYARQFAPKLIVTTIDQILKFPFYYRGFEKELATLAGAKVVIDEMQAYEPRIAALIIRALKMIDEFGGKFMIMTATMPKIYLDTLQKELAHSTTPLFVDTFVDDSVKRHHIRLRDKSILEDADLICCVGEQKKVLVICNTVKRAKEMYDVLKKQKGSIPVKLLHSKFTQADRARLEAEILAFANDKTAKGIWVTTQLVEASLDIDFDLLFTEMSVLDSQFQRYGRCNRKGLKDIAAANVYVYTRDISGKGSVYDKKLLQRSLSLLETVDGTILLESKKLEMIEALYDPEELKKDEDERSFYNIFTRTLRELKERPLYEITGQEAQDLLRDIQQILVIPEELFLAHETQQVVEQFRLSKDRKERRLLRRELERLTVSANRFKAKQVGIHRAGLPEELKDMWIISCQYDPHKGLELDQEIDPFS